MKVLVTGGLGTLGCPLVELLEERGHEVWTCDLMHSHRTRHVRCDVASHQQLSALFREHDFQLVYHLAAEYGRWNGEAYYDRLWETNVVGTKNLIREQEARAFQMVFASSSEVYGDYAGLMSEDVMDTHPIRQLNDYAISKWVNELQIRNSEAMHGTQTVRVRLFNTYGPGEYYTPFRSAICRFIHHALHDLPYTVYTSHLRTSTFVADTIRTLAAIAERFQAGEVYNIGGGELHDMRRVSDLILAHLGKTDRLVTYADAEQFTTGEKHVSTEKAVRDLDHRVTVSLEDGIPVTVRWMRKVYGFRDE